MQSRPFHINPTNGFQDVSCLLVKTYQVEQTVVISITLLLIDDCHIWQ